MEEAGADDGLGNFSATQQEKKIAANLAENVNDIKVSSPISRRLPSSILSTINMYRGTKV